jgi:Family of unknown function (DUF6600)
MKLKMFLAAILMITGFLFIGCASSNVGQSNETEYNGYNVDDLNSYGEWTYIEGYGRVWRPFVVSNWQPYYHGHWVYSGTDWVWVSYEPFGWIVYHYGYWNYLRPYGWIWIPSDDEWSPARVQWIEYGDYIGWSPLAYGGVNWPEPWENSDVHPWNVVKREDFNQENIGSHRVKNPPPGEMKEPGRLERRRPDVKMVEQYVKAPISVVKIEREPVRVKKEVVKKEPIRNEPIRQEPVKIEKEPVKVDTKPIPPPSEQVIHQLKVPKQETDKIERYRENVEKNVLIPRSQKKEEPPKKPK